MLGPLLISLGTGGTTIRTANVKEKEEKIICDALRDFGSVTIWRLHGRSSACKCMLTLCSMFILFLSVRMS